MKEANVVELKGLEKGVVLEDYRDFLKEVKERIQTAQVKASLAVNRELILLYWRIGKSIVERQREKDWGSGVVARLARDLKSEFPDMRGFSRPNLFRMRGLYLAYEKVSQAMRQLEELPVFSIPWGHNIDLIDKIKNTNDRLWYAHKTIEYGWSRAVLGTQIESKLHLREGKAISNFSMSLPKPQSDLASQTLKDPYCFDFLTLEKDFLEKELEQGLMNHLQKFMVELGAGFSFVGRQYPLEVAGKEYQLDLLFYHLKLRCYCVVESLRVHSPQLAA